MVISVLWKHTKGDTYIMRTKTPWWVILREFFWPVNECQVNITEMLEMQIMIDKKHLTEDDISRLAKITKTSKQFWRNLFDNIK